MRVYQVPQHAFLLLVGGALLAAAPHLLLGPPWLRILLPLLLLARVLIQRGRLAMPGRMVRVVLLAGVVLGTLYTHGTVLGPEAGTCLLIAAFGLKTLEMFRLRDAYVLLVLGYFVLATTFLFYQSPLAALYVFVVMVLLTASLVGINRPETGARSRTHLRLASVMLLQALPLMVLLFVLVPRIAPLWALEFQSEGARTGMSDSMAPGEVSRLTESTELAFRVEFEGAVPSPAERYWRGMTYSLFDGRRWSQASPGGLPRPDLVIFPGQGTAPWHEQLQAQHAAMADTDAAPVYRYRVVQEASRRPWLYTLAVPFVRGPARGIGQVRDFRLVKEGDIEQRFAYSVESYPLLTAAVGLPDWERDFNLALPELGNPRSRQLAQRLFDAEGGDVEAYALRVLAHFRQEPFYYTLEPPLLGGNTVDEFLFDTRRGFCEHYASAFAFMMRAAGVPARIVAGYQGGELNPVGNHLRVHQYHAHAWAEIWIDGQGWVEFDPTGAVAPERIERGMDRFLGREMGALQNLLSGAAFSRNPLLARLRNSIDYLQFSWQKWVLGYDESSQMAFLERWLKDVSPLRIGLVLLIGTVAILLPVALWVLLRRRGPPRSPLQREYRALRKQLLRSNIAVSEGLPPRAVSETVARACPAAADAIRAWVSQYEQAAYAEHADAQALQRLRRLRRALRWRLRRSALSG
ncbi:DUF3488 and transglutaminase-like domain-containing protein [Alcanivorax sp. JB21]|uniref:transglutaminase family protein n=1 Tax=Alcanivorax limicola TaxID=2874102 RepID=UPI001CBB002F|nr:DUF3488 and transglutaminase-like domain-containing protein [Alcanivorax limicola]MBZ2187684.1 DUF3488 and transglutaminase-like domain-containing protein [Alcanivorax limicola]